MAKPCRKHLPCYFEHRFLPKVPSRLRQCTYPPKSPTIPGSRAPNRQRKGLVNGGGVEPRKSAYNTRAAAAARETLELAQKTEAKPTDSTPSVVLRSSTDAGSKDGVEGKTEDDARENTANEIEHKTENEIEDNLENDAENKTENDGECESEDETTQSNCSSSETITVSRIPSSMPPPDSPVPWQWQCHQCQHRYRLGVTKRCLDCEHIRCCENVSDLPLRDRCEDAFDYAGWQAWAEWRREAGLPIAGCGQNGHECQYPRHCFWKIHPDEVVYSFHGNSDM